jgi:hypothetical protein
MTSIEFRNRPVRAKSDGCRLRQGYGASRGEAVTGVRRDTSIHHYIFCSALRNELLLITLTYPHLLLRALS